ncbi:MAG: DUF1553 domain-containing protein [Rubripirellula sp.]
MAKHTILSAGLWFAALAFPIASAEDSISFSESIRPILSDKCFHCHGPDADNQDSEFRLDTAEHAFADLGGYAGIVPGKPDESELLQRIHADSDDGDVMPPSDSVRQLTEEEKELLRKWIEQGADFEGHWAFQSVPTEVPVPEAANDWATETLDHFIFEDATAAGLKPHGPANAETWLRRVTFDLTGLPPTLNEIDEFLRNPSADARASVVDRLLASDACAERLASEWLDVARYSDSFGYQRDDERYVWPYRDWVVRAFAENKSYDQFVTEQLAGDLLENPTREQVLATTFNRLHSHKKEGGVAIEEFRVENVSDRAHTFAAAFMGLTMECARCHDHKYDPIKTKEYYELSAFFANIDERGLISYFTDATPTPAMPLPTPEQEAKLELHRDAIAERETAYAEHLQSSQNDFQQWLDDRKRSAPPIAGLIASLSFEEKMELGQDEAVLNEQGKKLPASEEKKVRHLHNDVQGTSPAISYGENHIVDGVVGQGMQLSGDDSVVVPEIGHFRRHDPFSYSIWIQPAELEERGVIYRRSRGWDDAASIGYELTKLDGRLTARLVHFWPGNAIAIETKEILRKGEWHHVAVTYDGSSKAAGLAIYVDGEKVATRVVQDSLTRKIVDWINGHDHFAIGTRYRDRGFKEGIVDEFRGFDRQLSALEVAHLADDPTLERLLTKKTNELKPHDIDLLHEHWELAVDAQAAELRDQLRDSRKSWNEVMDATPAITIMREQKQPREAYVLKRGVYDSHGEQVSADTPEFLPPYPNDQPRNRLGLARWLLSDDHPLTARVVVNRYWQLMFGRGLVRTPEDFGIQGQAPTHPALLDWLSRDLIDHDWDIRRLLRLIAVSATYGQESVVPRTVRDRDPENRYWARGPSQRLSAEMVRDNALSVSGMLVADLGGPPVKPYDVALAYTPMEVGEDDSLYRRSLYTFWKRTSPAPVMIAMNASKREVCRLRREIVPSPLQALVLLNGTQFVETARVTAAHLIEKHDDDIESIARDGYRLLTSRHPSTKETEVLVQLHQDQLEYFSQHLEEAKALLSVGDNTHEATLAADELAATTVLVNTLMNLDQSVRN